jgi:hypothetical protein
VLSTLDQEHLYFSKGYKPPVKERKAETGFIDEEDQEFLEGLPDLKGVAKYTKKSRATYLFQKEKTF